MLVRILLGIYISKLVHCSYQLNNKLSGAAEARRAHNPEDTGSKPVSAIQLFALFLLLFTLLTLHTPYAMHSAYPIVDVQVYFLLRTSPAALLPFLPAGTGNVLGATAKVTSSCWVESSVDGACTLVRFTIKAVYDSMLLICAHYPISRADSYLH